MKHAAWLLVATAALAGCSGDGDDTTSGITCDAGQYLDAAGVCADEVAPHIVLSGLSAAIQQFSTATFSWSLDPGTRGLGGPAVHSMDSRILASASNDGVDNTTGPDAWGTEVAKQQHKDFPQNFTATFSWEQTGTVYLKGYMLVDGRHLWQDLGTVDVTQVVATGTVAKTITISFPPALDEAEVGVVVGDAVAFTNDAPYAYIISFEGSGCPAGGAIGADATMAFDFLLPGSCAFALASPLGDAGADPDPGALDGKVTVSKP